MNNWPTGSKYHYTATTQAAKSRYGNSFKAKSITVYTILLHGPFGRVESSTTGFSNRTPGLSSRRARAQHVALGGRLGI